jgi:hypothetical protein
MAKNPFEFLQGWARENVNATSYGDDATAKHLAGECLRAAEKAGFGETSITKAAGGNLASYMRSESESAVSRELERLVSKRDK